MAVKLENNIGKITTAFRREAGKAVSQTAEKVKETTQSFAPVKTGALRDSYQSEKTGELSAQVGTDVNYSVFLEYGTSRAGAQPHLTPAFAGNEQTFENALSEAGKRAAG